MKDFEEFKAYMRENGQSVHEDIHKTVLNVINKNDYSDDIGMQNEDYHRAWGEIGFMKMLEQYHNWITS